REQDVAQRACGLAELRDEARRGEKDLRGGVHRRARDIRELFHGGGVERRRQLGEVVRVRHERREARVDVLEGGAGMLPVGGDLVGGELLCDREVALVGGRGVGRGGRRRGRRRDLDGAGLRRGVLPGGGGLRGGGHGALRDGLGGGFLCGLRGLAC